MRGSTPLHSPFTYLISVVNLAIKANCLVCRSEGRSVTESGIDPVLSERLNFYSLRTVSNLRFFQAPYEALTTTHCRWVR